MRLFLRAGEKESEEEQKIAGKRAREGERMTEIQKDSTFYQNILVFCFVQLAPGTTFARWLLNVARINSFSTSAV